MATPLTTLHYPLVREHLLRLPDEDRRRRFGTPLKDSAIAAYVDRLDPETTQLYGQIEGERLVALAEIFPAGAPDICEAAFSVDPDRRREGLGRTILTRALDRAADAGFARMILYIQQANTPMREIARKHGFQLRLDEGDYLATRALAPADHAVATAPVTGPASDPAACAVHAEAPSAPAAA